MQEIRNIAIIAHVDHGKTTLVDKIIYYSQLLRETEEKVDLILDSNDLEREEELLFYLKMSQLTTKELKSISLIPPVTQILGRSGTRSKNG